MCMACAHHIIKFICKMCSIRFVVRSMSVIQHTINTKFTRNITDYLRMRRSIFVLKSSSWRLYRTRNDNHARFTAVQHTNWCENNSIVMMWKCDFRCPMHQHNYIENHYWHNITLKHSFKWFFSLLRPTFWNGLIRKMHLKSYAKLFAHFSKDTANKHQTKMICQHNFPVNILYPK